VKGLDGLGRGLLLLVGLWLVLPALWQLLQAVLPLILTLLALVVIFKVILGKVTKWW
jgi:hypothetical protein